jgi:large subunit ribosomal protein L1
MRRLLMHLTTFFSTLKQCIASQTRLFSTSHSLQISRRIESKIRVPSKKALAAKNRRKAAAAAKEDARFLKLPLVEAINVLRVSREETSPRSPSDWVFAY